VDETYQQLKSLADLTMELNKLLSDGDFEEILQKLKMRRKLLDLISPEKVAELKNQRHSDAITAIIEKIKSFDKNNMEILDQRIKTTVDAMLKLSKEKKTMKGLQSLSKVGKRQIIDMLY